MMKRNTTRLLSCLVLAALLLLPAVGAFAADPPYTIKYLKGGGSDFQGAIKTSDETPIGKVLKDKFNIVFEIEPFAGDWKEKTNLMLATGDYPEIVQLINNDDVVKWIDAGAVIPLDDLMAKYGKNFTALHAAEIPIWRSVAKDGKIYKYEMQVPDQSGYTDVYLDMAVRSDALEAMNWPKLNSVSSWISFLKGVLAKMPETNGRPTLGISANGGESWGPAIWYNCMTYTGRYLFGLGYRAVLMDTVTNKLMDIDLCPQTKESVKFWNTAYREGLLDREALTDKWDAVQAKMNNAQSVAIYYTTWFIPTANAALKTAGRETMSYVTLPIRLDSQVNNKETRYLRNNNTYPYGTVVLTKKAKYPDRIMKLLDYIATDEGQTLIGWGIKGTHYTVEKGKRVVMPGVVESIKTDKTYLERQGLLPVFNFLGASRARDTSGQFRDFQFDPDYNALALIDREKQALKAYGLKTKYDFWSTSSTLKYYNVAALESTVLAADSEENKVLQKAIKLRHDMYLSQLVMAETESRFEQIWTEYLKEHAALNPKVYIDKLTELYNQNVKIMGDWKIK
jgi:putative aldouronate transport system substrate-binding protein